MFNRHLFFCIEWKHSGVFFCFHFFFYFIQWSFRYISTRHAIYSDIARNVLQYCLSWWVLHLPKIVIKKSSITLAFFFLPRYFSLFLSVLSFTSGFFSSFLFFFYTFLHFFFFLSYFFFLLFLFSPLLFTRFLLFDFLCKIFSFLFFLFLFFFFLLLSFRTYSLFLLFFVHVSFFLCIYTFFFSLYIFLHFS